MWRDRPVSVILPTYNERDSIRQTIEEFWATGLVDEVIVVNNNAVPGTSDEVRRTRAVEVFEPRQGYGAAIRRGFQEAQGYYLAVCEPDGTFLPSDLLKLLAYTDDFEFVVGTRAMRELVWAGANMGPFLKWGNFAVAKLFEFLFNTILVTDVGCTLRVLTRPALETLRPRFRGEGSAFGLEMMLLAAIHRVPFIQIPVHYRKRVGRSSVTGDAWKAVGLGLTMIAMVLTYRLRPRRGDGATTPEERFP
ncbi:MAG: glycosyl transferase [Omnitrophica WOR_2 bacterium RIFCSPHIGHO2_02_FULL_68_15]|nr:MAG: glycosyl transferase [Omnitrophica WOR_2 bacterium RIFCSPHIGHO2_02_FULL_68_15]